MLLDILNIFNNAFDNIILRSLIEVLELLLSYRSLTKYYI